jgi:hypothetical protein
MSNPTEYRLILAAVEVVSEIVIPGDVMAKKSIRPSGRNRIRRRSNPPPQLNKSSHLD